MKLGDAVATVAQPIARRIDSVLGTDLTNCQSCHGPDGRQARLNRLSDSVIDFFARRLTGSSSDMDPKPFFIVSRTKQILVQADTPEAAEEAMAKGQGQTISLNGSVQLRQQPQMPVGPVITQQPPVPGRG